MDNKLDKIDIIGKCLSVNITPYANFKTDKLGRIIALENSYDAIRLPDSKKLSNLKFEVLINIVGSSFEEKDIFSLGLDKLNIGFVIKRCSEDKDERLSMEVHNFEIDLTKAKEVEGSGFPKTINTRRFLSVDEIDFSDFEKPLGKYMLYTRIKFEDTDKIVVKGLIEFELI